MAPVTPSRPERLGDQVRAELAALLQRSVRDPALGLVTVTHVRMTKDLRHARVFYTTLAGPDDRRATERGLRRAGPFLRRQLAQRIRVRHVPELTFVYDESLDREQRVAELLEAIAETPAPPPDPSDTDQ